MRAVVLAVALLLPTPTKACKEDDPCWDCHTMGNKLCSKNERRA